MKRIAKFIHFGFASLALACFTLSPQVQATPDPESVGPFNTADGDHALFSNTTGVANAAFGWYALFANTEGNNNTAVGAGALDFNNRESNTAVGAAALLLNTTGVENTAVGTGSGQNIVSGSNNTYLGNFVGGGSVGDESSTIRINDVSGGNALECFIGGIFNNFQPIAAHGGSPGVVVVTLDLADDHLGWDILSDEPAAQASVQVHLQATVAQQQKQIETLTAQVRKQAAQIQKVSAELELTKAAPQRVLKISK